MSNKDYIVNITDGDFDVTVNTDGEYIVNVGEYISGVGFSNLGSGAQVLNDTSSPADIQFRTLVAETAAQQSNIVISQEQNEITIGTKQDITARNFFADSFQAQTGSFQTLTGSVTNLLSAGSLQVLTTSVLPNITMNGTLSGTGDIDISGDITAPNMNFSGTITGSDYDNVATIDGPGNITITTGDANFLFADTQDFYVGDLAQAAHITGTTIGHVGERLEITGELFGAVEFIAKNREGSELAKGTPVYISGHNGNTTEVKRADANDPAKMSAFGITADVIGDNTNGSIVTFGELRGFDTSTFAVGDELYVSDTGTLTNVRPTAQSSQVQKMAKVVRSHAENGILFVTGAGRSNDIPNEFSHSLIPDTDLAYDLGSPTHQWRSAYVGPGSLYIDGHKVLGSDVTGDIDLTTDPDQNLNVQAGGTITMLSTGETTTLSDATINLSSASGTTNVLGTLDVADHLEVGDTNYDNGLIEASGISQNLEIRTNGTGYLHANIAGSAYFGSFTNAIQLNGTTISAIGADLTIDDSVDITGTLDVTGAVTTANLTADDIAGDKLTVTGSASTKTTVIGDSTAGGVFDIHGFTVDAGDTAWAGVNLVETTGDANKPINGFSNPSYGTTIYGGTVASKAAVENGKRIWTAYALTSQDGTTPATANFRILAETTEQQSSSARGAKATFETTANGNTATTKTLEMQDYTVTINPDGDGVLKSGGNLSLDDDVTVTGTLAVNGATNLNGNVTLGDANTDTITATGKLKASNGFGNTVLDVNTANYLSGVLGIVQTGDQAYISDGNGGTPCMAFYDGSNWKRMHSPTDNISST